MAATAETLERPGGGQGQHVPLPARGIAWLGRRYGFIGVTCALALWQLATGLGLFGPQFSDALSPARAMDAFRYLVTSGALVENALPSLQRVGVGLAAAIAIGIPTGLAVGFNPKVEKSTYVIFQFLRMVSPLAWMPIAIVALGVGDAPVYFLVAIAAVWPIIINTAHGTSQVDRVWVRMARTLGAGTKEVFSRVVVPAVIPDMLMGLRVALGVSWVILVPAEMLGVSSGLGYYILDTRDRFAYSELVAVILAIGAIGFALDSVLRRLRAGFNWKAAEEQ